MRRGGPQTRGPRWSVSRSMSWRWSGSTFVTLAGAIGVAVCALYAWRRRGSPAAASLAVALLAATEWSLAHTLELSGGNLATRQLGGELRFIGTCLLPPACLIFMLQYSGRIRRPSRSMLALLAIEPLVVLTTLAIPATRHLMISWDPRAPGASPAACGLGPSARPGPLYWVDFEAVPQAERDPVQRPARPAAVQHPLQPADRTVRQAGPHAVRLRAHLGRAGLVRPRVQPAGPAPGRPQPDLPDDRRRGGGPGPLWQGDRRQPRRRAAARPAPLPGGGPAGGAGAAGLGSGDRPAARPRPGHRQGGEGRGRQLRGGHLFAHRLPGTAHRAAPGRP